MYQKPLKSILKFTHYKRSEGSPFSSESNFEQSDENEGFPSF